MRDRLEKQFGAFLRRKRGEMSFAQFSRKVGLPPSTLYRVERGEQSITLRMLQHIVGKLKCRLGDVFPEQFDR